eukprot:GABV01004638.1.p1 GENE.GABV01004638.1~~GABV01004638.1.p1  ORF type:complete len:130 (+),score=38.34 GABV01004638.1:42-431(+)
MANAESHESMSPRPESQPLTGDNESHESSNLSTPEAPPGSSSTESSGRRLKKHHEGGPIQQAKPHMDPRNPNIVPKQAFPPASRAAKWQSKLPDKKGMKGKMHDHGRHQSTKFHSKHLPDPATAPRLGD